MADPFRVVVVGGGFGGLATVRTLAREVKDRPVEVTLVDRHNYHTFQPLLYQVATAGLQAQDVGQNLRAIFGRSRSRRPSRSRRRLLPGPAQRSAVEVEVRLGEVVEVDTTGREVRLADGSTLPYDRLVLAAGAVTADYGTAGVAAHAFGLKSLPDAVALRNHILRRFEAASAGVAEEGGLTFVIIGAGPTGVELAGTLAELVDLVIRRDHPRLDLAQVRILLVEMQDRVLPPFSEVAGRSAHEALRRRGVEVHLGRALDEVAIDHVVFDDGEKVPTQTVVWAAGVTAGPVLEGLGLEPGEGGRIPVDRRLRVTGVEGVYAVGDIAGASAPDGELFPQLAPVALQQGKYVGEVLAAEAEGRRGGPPFRYRDRGTMATVGRRAAVADLPAGLRLRGTIAWFAWLGLHLLYLVGFKNRAGVLLSWLWNYAMYDHAARLILDQEQRPDLLERGQEAAVATEQEAGPDPGRQAG